MIFCKVVRMIPVEGDIIKSASESRDEVTGERVTELGIHAVLLCAVKSLSIEIAVGKSALTARISRRRLRMAEEMIYGVSINGGFIKGIGSGCCVAMWLYG